MTRTAAQIINYLRKAEVELAGRKCSSSSGRGNAIRSGCRAHGAVAEEAWHGLAKGRHVVGWPLNRPNRSKRLCRL